MDSPEPEEARPRRLVLVADDEDDVREMVQAVLSSAGFESLSARDGQEALEVIQRRSGRVDLVLTDVMMPGFDGPTLARRLAHEWPEIPVLFMTGYMSEALAARGLLPAEVPRIEKPFRISFLIGKVRAALGLPPLDRPPRSPAGE
ncbi:MAG TPA: response regulator [Planctomycetota bacterium]|nr:response regulator [Planctomycetota bacterium]